MPHKRSDIKKMLLAIKNGKITLAGNLLKAGFDVNWKDRVTGRSLMHYAALSTHPNASILASILKIFKVDKDLKDKNGDTPLDLALHHKNNAMIINLVPPSRNSTIYRTQEKSNNNPQKPHAGKKRWVKIIFAERLHQGEDKLAK